MLIPLKTGELAIIDDEDAHLVMGFTWYLHKKGYACAFLGRRVVYMHRLILGAPARVQVDHKNTHNKLDNRKNNLRLATGRQQQGNRRINSGCKSSKYKGVSWLAKKNRWRATLGYRRNNKRTTVHLGLFTEENDAALAYNRAATDYFGKDFAFLNVVVKA